MRGKPQEIEPWTGTGGHGGGDNVMLTEVFGTAEPDKYKRAADERSGLYSFLIGASANKSFVTGGAVKVADLVTGLTSPMVAPMPTRNDPVPMPVKAESDHASGSSLIAGSASRAARWWNAPGMHDSAASVSMKRHAASAGGLLVLGHPLRRAGTRSGLIGQTPGRGRMCAEMPTRQGLAVSRARKHCWFRHI